MSIFQRFGGLWRHPDFMKLWTGQTISHFGSHIGGGALRFTAILMLAATPLQISLLTAASMLPILLISLPAGVWVDRLRRRPILIAADIGRALLLLSIPLAYWLDVLRIEQLYLVAALTGVLTICFDVAYQSFLPAVVQRANLVEGNSKLGMSDSVAEIAGPPAGGLLVQIISAPFAILLDSLSFLVSAAAIWRIGAAEPAPQVTQAQSSVRRDVVEGLQAVLHDELLRALLLAGVTFNLFGNIIGALYDIYLIRELGMSPAIVGVTIGVGGVSALIGAFVAQPMVRRFGLGPTIAGALLTGGISGALIPLARGPIAVALPMILLSQANDIAFAVFFINELSLRQTITPDRLLGRVNASFSFVLTGAALLGALLGGVLGQWIGLRPALAVAVAGVIAAGVSLWLSPVRGLRNAPATPGERSEPVPAA